MEGGPLVDFFAWRVALQSIQNDSPGGVHKGEIDIFKALPVIGDGKPNIIYSS